MSDSSREESFFLRLKSVWLPVVRNQIITFFLWLRSVWEWLSSEEGSFFFTLRNLMSQEGPLFTWLRSIWVRVTSYFLYLRSVTERLASQEGTFLFWLKSVWVRLTSEYGPLLTLIRSLWMHRPRMFDTAMGRVANPFQSRRWRGRYPLPIVVGCTLLVIVSVVRMNTFRFDEGENLLITTVQEKPKSFHTGGVFVNRETIDGTDVFWASPKDNQQTKVTKGESDKMVPADTKSTINGLLFLAHGCGHSNLDWFAKSPDCEDCRGLPEERAIVQIALDLGLVAIATSASDKGTKCWDNYDTTHVAMVLNELWHRFSQEQHVQLLSTTKQQQLPPTQKLPIYAFGASSGGEFVSRLAGPLRSRYGIQLDGFVSQIAAHLPLLREDDKDPHLCRVYATMNKDERTNEKAEARTKKCRSEEENTMVNGSIESDKNPEAISNKCKHIRLPALPITPSYFADRIPEISVDESKEMVEVLVKTNVLDPNTGELLEDPRRRHHWPDALLKASSSQTSLLEFRTRNDYLVPDESPITEVMNVAWGYHEMTRDGVGEALEFCIAHQHLR